MIDFIIHAVLFVAWLTYTFPPLASSKNKAAQTARAVVMAVLSGCIGFGFGCALLEVLKG